MNVLEKLKEKETTLETLIRYYEEETPDDIERINEFKILLKDTRRNCAFLQIGTGTHIPPMAGMDTFSKPIFDRNQLLSYISEICFPYRESLNFSDEHEIGMQILSDGNRTLEWCNTKEEWIAFKRNCEELKKSPNSLENLQSIKIYGNSSIVYYSEKTIKNLIKLWVVYEPVLFKLFTRGEKNHKKMETPEVMRSILGEKLAFIDKNTLKEIQKTLQVPSYLLDINYFKNKNIQTENNIGIQIPYTTNATVLQNKINVLLHLLRSVREKNTVSEFLKDKMSQVKLEKATCYNEMHLKEAFELCDFLFVNNIDKYYFLGGYLSQKESYTGMSIPALNDRQPNKIMVK